mmetsp:Transcript_18637/g.53749  ORF Transcript_18637/g.53749 Transcript_18637/m.53749 type:complete len:89 (-) Transcript_18637:700-966(-)
MVQYLGMSQMTSKNMNTAATTNSSSGLKLGTLSLPFNMVSPFMTSHRASKTKCARNVEQMRTDGSKYDDFGVVAVGGGAEPQSDSREN